MDRALLRLAMINTVRIWNIDTRRELRSLFVNAGSVLGLAYSPDGERLASMTDDMAS